MNPGEVNATDGIACFSQTARLRNDQELSLPHAAIALSEPANSCLSSVSVTP